MGSQLRVSGGEHEQKVMLRAHYIKDMHISLAYINTGFGEWPQKSCIILFLEWMHMDRNMLYITVKRPICLYPVCCPFLNYPKHLRSFVKMLVELECISILHEYRYLLNVGSYICVSVPLCLSCCRSMCLSPRCEVEDKQWEGPKVIKVMWLHVCVPDLLFNDSRKSSDKSSGIDWKLSRWIHS